MAKKKWFLLVWVFCLLLVTTTGGVSAATMTDNLLPNQEEEKVGSVELESGKYPLVNYGMDTDMEEEKMSDLLPWNWDDTVGKSINGILSTINSGIWKVNVILSSFTIAVVHESYSSDIVGEFGQKIGELIKTVTGVSNFGFSSNSIWGTFMYLIIIMAVAWLGYRAAILRQGSVALGGFVSIIFILALSIGFFTNADKVLTTMNDLTNEAKNVTLSYAAGKINDEDFQDTEGLATMKNQLFNTMIKNPWLLMQFGTIDQEAIEKEWDKKGSRIHALLSTSPYSEERKEAIQYEVKEMKNQNMSTGALLDRLVVNAFIFAANGVLGTFSIMLNGSMVIYAFLALIYAVQTVLTLLISLFPAFQNTGINSFKKLGHAFYMQLGLAFLCTVNFSFTNWIYSWVKPDMGMLMIFVFQIAVVALIFFKRKELLNIINKPFEGLKLRSDRGMDSQRYKQLFQKTKTNAIKLTKPFYQPAIKTGLSAFGKIKSNPGVGVVGHGPIYKNLKSINELKTGTMAKNESSNASGSVKTKTATAQNKAGSELKTGEKVANATQTVQNAQGSETNAAPNVKTMNHSNPTQKVDVNISERPKGTEYGPPLHDEENLRSLEKTLNKGGYAHKVKDGGEIQTAERKIKINDWKENHKNVSEQK